MDRRELEKAEGRKKVMLKQYLVSGAPKGAKKVRKGALIVHTCPKLANEEFRKKFPDCQIWSTTQVAYTKLSKDDMEGRDFWADGENTVFFEYDSDDWTPGLF